MPSTGPLTNCMRPQTTPKIAVQTAASAVVAELTCPKNERIRLGRTGIISPNESEFITVVAKMKPKAACRPRGARAAGNALGSNPIPIVIPCHRVLRAGGHLGGYGGGLDRKRWLLDLESRGAH